MACCDQIVRTYSKVSLAALLTAVSGLATSSNAAWVPATGIKTGASADTEPSSLYVGPQLQVFGGSLNFLGSATINGPVLLEQRNGWGTPIVNVAGVFSMQGSSFTVLNGARFTANAVASSINTSFLTVNGGSEVKVGKVTAADKVAIVGAGTSLRVLGNYAQTAGEFRLGDFGVPSLLEVGGSFNYTGNRFIVSEFATFGVTNAAASSISTGELFVGSSEVKVNSVAASDNVAIVGDGTSLRVLGNYTQTAGEFRLGDFGVPSLLEVGGSFNYTGNRFIVSEFATFGVTNAAASSISTGELFVGSRSEVKVRTVTASDNCIIGNTGTSLRVLGDYTQTGGILSVRDYGLLAVGETLHLASAAVLDAGNVGRVELGTTTLPASLSEIRVGSGGTLSGDGLVLGNIVVESGGKILPGASLSSLAVTGSLRFLNGSNLSLDLAGPDSFHFDRLQVSGNVVLAGTLAIELRNGFIARPSNVVSLVSLNGLRTGTFNTIVPPAGYAAVPTYTATGLNISLSRTCPADLNADSLVDDADFSLFVIAYNILDCNDPAMAAWCPADINNDNVVDDADFALFVGAYDQLLCP